MPNLIKAHLAAINSMFHVKDHCRRELRYSWSKSQSDLLWVSLIHWELTGYHCVLEKVTANIVSLICIRKSREPSMCPWVTPDMTAGQLDIYSLSCTIGDLFEMYQWNQDQRGLEHLVSKFDEIQHQHKDIKWFQTKGFYYCWIASVVSLLGDWPNCTLCWGHFKFWKDFGQLLEVDIYFRLRISLSTDHGCLRDN